MSAPRTSRLRCSIASGTETSNPAHSRKHCCLSCGEVSSHPPFLFYYKTVLLKNKNAHRLSVFLASDTVLPFYVHVCCSNGYVCVCVCAGPTVPLHIPVVGVHRHRHHLHHHPPRRHRPAADAHSQVLLLGHQSAGVQRDHPQRSRYVHTRNTLREKNTVLGLMTLLRPAVSVLPRLCFLVCFFLTSR